MSRILFKVSKGDTCLKDLQLPIESNSIEDLITSLKTTKTLSNDFLTHLVNEEKCDSKPTRKIDELASSGEEEGNLEDDTKRQKKSEG